MKISLYEGFAAIFTEELNVDWHSHAALQVVVSINQSPVECETEAGTVSAGNILIPSLTSHRFQNAAGPLLILLIDDESSLADACAHKGVVEIPGTEMSGLLDYLKLKNFDPVEFQNVLLQTSLLKGFANPHLDERILRLVSHFKTHDEQDLPSAKRAAAFCHLSESRFLHLFKKELGLPFRKYLLWLKLRRFFSHLQNGKNITTAAHEAGFSDSSHLSRFFADSFGLNPSEILKNSQFIQVS